ncbi:exosortase F system-associated membrane protein [Flavobacterium sp. ACAM 123]|jgi:exosortase F-associated protein|uniref:exosortase F system-associated membrane protein n=1 Tax=Flavobacterium sp. ACAM 123 TaxID=1189620 RepID=UPI0003777065|nr:exosortase F system-associated protein [Flavobacterium sp. ACAM 123]
MLKVLLLNKLRILLGLVFVLALVVVRAYEDLLFYDPFLNYFKRDFNALPLPSYDSFHLLLGLLFRYVFNMVLSLGLLYTIFRDLTMIKFASILYVFFFLILVSLFYVVIYFYGAQNNLMLFYIRRFLIQPIFVILFIPAFYYQKWDKRFFENGKN